MGTLWSRLYSWFDWFRSAAGPALTSAPEEYVEVEVCDEHTLQDGQMKEVEVGEQKALLVRDGGEYHALSPKCTHYGAPLIKGALCNGHVRCPWHGACFNVRTGDIEDFPGLDSLHRYEVNVTAGKVRVRAPKKAHVTKYRQKEMCCCGGENTTVLIIGGGAAGSTCAETLRQEGFQGKVMVATKENCLPYDRPKLSKTPSATAESIALRSCDFYKQYDIEVLTSKEAVAMDTANNSVTFQDGSKINYDKLLIATGGSPRSLNIPGNDLKGVCILRTPDDANYIANSAKDKDVVVIGTSFIGMEMAAYSCGNSARSVTVIGRSDTPFAESLGQVLGKMWKKIHEDKGVQFIANNSAQEFVGEDGKLKEVVLKDGKRLPAELCVIGIGVFPTTEFLKGTDIDLSDRGFVKVNKHMQTNKENVFAAGDITEFPFFLNDDKGANVQHWQMANKQGKVAALNMLCKDVEIKSVPFFWTMMFGKSLRYTGYGPGYDDVIVKGDVDAFKFVAYYTKGDTVVAVASMNMDPIAAQAAEVLLSGKCITKQDICGDNHDCWLSRM